MKLSLTRIRLNNGGYDSCGNYCGCGTPLYQYLSDDGATEGTLRADSRTSARDQIRANYPEATFYR